jgi:4'-phosphopantetheinyl transferase
MANLDRHGFLWCDDAPAREVDVWARSAGDSEEPEAGLELLDDAERARATSFAFQRDRDRFVRRHVFARRVLAGYLGIDPAAIGIRPSPLGEPQIEPPCGVFYSLSQADDLTVLAVAQGRRLGVDIERLRHIDDALGIAAGLFAAPEVKLMRSVPPASRSSVFLKLWTRKEAVVKTIGGGLSIPLDGFSVLTQAGVAAGQPGDPIWDQPVAFASLVLPRGYVGTVATADGRVAVRYKDAATVSG